MPIQPEHRSIFVVDIEGFSRPDRTDPVQLDLHRDLRSVLREVLAAGEIDPAACAWEDRGDGFLLSISPDVPKNRLLDPMVSLLVSRLVDHNDAAPSARRLRLRVVVHAGEVLRDPEPTVGQAVVFACRLLDSSQLRACLAATNGPLALAVSDRIHEDVVRHGYGQIDPSAFWPISFVSKGTSGQAWLHVPGDPDAPHRADLKEMQSTQEAATPRELPADIEEFTGRDDELNRLIRAVGEPGRAGTVAISAINGMGGIGKSALAIHAAHQLADAFPDGQLYVDLQGASTTRGLAPLAPEEALGRMLRGLGLDPAAIPTEVGEAAARFRSLAAGRRLLVLLDNARDAQQVRPLLPGGRTCGVLVTSRQILATLVGTEALHLDVLPQGQALELLGRIAGRQRVAAESQAAGEVVRWCGYLPLAIRIVGARLAARPTWPIRELAGRLADATHRLDQLQTEGLVVRASFDVSLHALQESPDPSDQAAAAAFGLLSLPDGSHLSLGAAARLLDQPEATAEVVLERLVDEQLLETSGPTRFRFHDLVRLYARQHAMSRHPEPERLVALIRTFSFYTATAWQTMALLRPGDRRVTTADPRWTDDGLPFADASAALAWLEAERLNLLAAIGQIAATPALPAGLASQLTRALFGFFEVHSYWQDAERANQTALRLARLGQDPAAQAHAHNDLGGIYLRLGRHEEAIASLQESLTIRRELGDRQGQAASLGNLGLVYLRLGRYKEALDCQQESLTICQELRDRQGQAASLGNLGVVYERLEQYREARSCQQESLTICQELRDRQGQALSLGNLGLVYLRLEQYRKATYCLERSRAIFREQGDRQGQALSLNDLGVVYLRLGRSADAIACLQESLIICRELGERHTQAEVLRDLGDALRAVDRIQQAQVAWHEALAICEELQIPEADEIYARLATLPPEASETASG